eukprot:jgi/Mesvir1/14471/Mv05179-RA.1
MTRAACIEGRTDEVPKYFWRRYYYIWRALGQIWMHKSFAKQDSSFIVQDYISGIVGLRNMAQIPRKFKKVAPWVVGGCASMFLLIHILLATEADPQPPEKPTSLSMAAMEEEMPECSALIKLEREAWDLKWEEQLDRELHSLRDRVQSLKNSLDEQVRLHNLQKVTHERDVANKANAVAVLEKQLYECNMGTCACPNPKAELKKVQAESKKWHSKMESVQSQLEECKKGKPKRMEEMCKKLVADRGEKEILARVQAAEARFHASCVSKIEALVTAQKARLPTLDFDETTGTMKELPVPAPTDETSGAVPAEDAGQQAALSEGMSLADTAGTDAQEQQVPEDGSQGEPQGAGEGEEALQAAPLEDGSEAAAPFDSQAEGVAEQVQASAAEEQVGVEQQGEESQGGGEQGGEQGGEEQGGDVGASQGEVGQELAQEQGTAQDGENAGVQQGGEAGEEPVQGQGQGQGQEVQAPGEAWQLEETADEKQLEELVAEEVWKAEGKTHKGVGKGDKAGV